MAEKNKPVELKSEELKHVSGGFGKEEEIIVYKVISDGDCFQCGSNKIKAIGDYRIRTDKPKIVEVYRYLYEYDPHDDKSNRIRDKIISSNEIFSEEYFVGKNIW